MKGAATSLPTIAVTGNSAVALDAQSGRVVGDYPVGNTPHAIAYGDGMAWTSNIADKTISQVDVAAGRVVKTYGLPTAALSLATGPGVVWMTNGFAGSVSRILVGYRQLSSPLLPEQRSAGMSAIAVTPTNLWVTSADRAAVELDPASLRAVATLPLRRQARSITVDSDALWSTDISGGLVERTSLTTGSPTQVAVQGTGREVVAGAGSVWVTSEKPNTLSRSIPSPVTSSSGTHCSTHPRPRRWPTVWSGSPRVTTEPCNGSTPQATCCQPRSPLVTGSAALPDQGRTSG